LATGDPNFGMSHTQKTTDYMTLLSANEACVIHVTGEADYLPIWQSEVELGKFAPDLDFTNVLMSARWKDCAGNIQQVDNQFVTVRCMKNRTTSVN
jgi:hypothetical protein